MSMEDVYDRMKEELVTFFGTISSVRHEASLLGAQGTVSLLFLRRDYCKLQSCPTFSSVIQFHILGLVLYTEPSVCVTLQPYRQRYTVSATRVHMTVRCKRNTSQNIIVLILTLTETSIIRALSLAFVFIIFIEILGRKNKKISA